MRRFFFLFPLFLSANILSDLQNKTLDLQKNRVIESSKATEKSWINPIILQYTITKDNRLENTKTTTKTFSVTLNQPVFKSGAIYYSIKYAKDSKNLNINNLILTKRKLIKTALDLAYDYKITKLNENIIKLQIKNALIDVKRKKEEYKNGTLDLTFLNNSIISLNSLKLSLEDIIQNLDNIRFNFKNISDADIEKINLNLFSIIPLKKYLNDNIELLNKKLSKKVNKDLYKMQIGDELVTVFINASWNYQDIDYSNARFQNDEKNFYSVGAGISIPIDFTAGNKIQKAKVNYLISKLDYLQKRKELINEYKNIFSNIKSVRKKISIYKENIKLYDELIISTKNNIKAGTATYDDLTILENTKEQNILQIKILKLQIQKLMLNLYYKLQNFSN